MTRIAVEKGRARKPGLECGICGEHGGDPQSISLCHELGLTLCVLLTFSGTCCAPGCGSGRNQPSGDGVARTVCEFV